MQLSPCIEWIFADEHEGLPDRIRAARAAGYRQVEFHLWRDKDIEGIAKALAETGVTLTGFCADPRRSLVDPAQHAELFAAVADSLVTARKLGKAPMIVASGFNREGISTKEHFDHAVTALKRIAAMAEDAGVMALLEPLNDRIDHPGMYLVSTTLGLDLIEAVGSPNLRLLYDAYHSAVMGEDARDVLQGRIHLVHHVQLADRPGRNEPGTGDLDLAGLCATLKDLGYQGGFGLEYRPTQPALASLAQARAALNA
ncbi:TIM barrel protein [Novosphingobium rosa]|uniref:TIM barrel protein n=1 Tax=Novosphingobium rosa TaxID=76978 RepID=UPI00082ADFB0|nr:TIM barrel protein [Novosphingobium rosa]